MFDFYANSRTHCCSPCNLVHVQDLSEKGLDLLVTNFALRSVSTPSSLCYTNRPLVCSSSAIYSLFREAGSRREVGFSQMPSSRASHHERRLSL